MNKEFAVYSPSNEETKESLKEFKTHGHLNVPKKAIGFVVCRGYFGNVAIITISFCSHSDKWDENEGKKLASERLYDVIGKLNIQNVREKVLGGKLQVSTPEEFAEKIIELDNNEGQL